MRTDMSETQESKICPMGIAPNQDRKDKRVFIVLDCKEKDCAWWTGERCAIAAIAAILADIHDLYDFTVVEE